ncbi:glycosyltransferase family 61 protein [Chryseolinea sp. T2]|uniref:glycosyltransferase family 61 protein n=1 Tax=Chryseolinea sp. T2 TaxID=3129255 RepID=UPI003076E2B6
MIERIKRRLKSELRLFFQANIRFNQKYKPKGIVHVQRTSDERTMYFELNPPHSSELTLSPEFIASCSPYIKPVMKIQTPGDFVSGLRNGRMYCTNVSHFTTITEDGYAVEELSFQWGDERIDETKENEIFKTKGFVKPKVYKGKVFSLMSGGGAKYFLYHWMLETVPKMHLFQQSGEMDKDSYFIVPNQRMQYQREFLNHFGIDEKHIIDEEKIHHIQADWLYVSSHVKYYDHHPAWSVDFLYRTIVLNPIKEPKKRIYISRGDAKNKRPVGNEAELEKMLLRLGFESVQLSPMSIYEKAAVINSASILVAVHGGGLANLVYCEPGTKVLEIFPDKYVCHAYHDISNKRALQHNYLLFPSIGEATDALNGQNLGLIVDVDVVESTILSMLG